MPPLRLPLVEDQWPPPTTTKTAPPGWLRPRRLRPALIAVVLAMLVLLAVPMAVEALTSPRTRVDQPASGAAVAGGDVTASGWARHSKGVAAVDVAIHRLDDDTYWNGTGWQVGFIRLPAVLERPAARFSRWSYTMAAADMSPGHYRVRALARSVEGNGDANGGDAHDFTYHLTPGPPTTVPASTTVPVTTVPPTTVPVTTVPPTTVPPPGCPGGNPAILVPCQGLLFGATGDFTNHDGSPAVGQDELLATEALVGATFDLYHEYLAWGDLVSKAWPSPRTRALADGGRTLLVNWKSPTGSPADWAGIAAGDRDADIVAAARQAVAFGQPLFLAFFHEPEDNIRAAAAGDAAQEQRYVDDYRAAFRHIHEVFVANGATNVVWVWNVQGYVAGWERYYSGGLYPGDDVVDWVAWDPYNWFGCETNSQSARWRTFTETVAPFYDWVSQGGPGRPSPDKPLMLAETGTEENTGAANSSQTKAGWLAEAQRVLPIRFPRLRALVYFDTEGRRTDGTTQFCDWGLDSSPQAAAAMGAILRDPALAAG